MLFSSSITLADIFSHVKKNNPHNVNELKDQIRLFEQHVFDDQLLRFVAFSWVEGLDSIANDTLLPLQALVRLRQFLILVFVDSFQSFIKEIL